MTTHPNLEDFKSGTDPNGDELDPLKLADNIPRPGEYFHRSDLAVDPLTWATSNRPAAPAAARRPGSRCTTSATASTTATRTSPPSATSATPRRPHVNTSHPRPAAVTRAPEATSPPACHLVPTWGVPPLAPEGDRSA